MAQTLQELLKSLREAEAGSDRAAKRALVEVTLRAEAQAKVNAKAQFTGRNGRTLTGALLNSIYSGFDFNDSTSLTSFVGVRNIPYGRIHEFGGDITPKKANHLWVKNHAVPRFKRMTPREFMEQRLRAPEEFKLFESKRGTLVAWHVEPKGRGARARVTALFFLLDKVRIPDRPYVTPAVEQAWDAFPLAFARQLAREVGL
jgi:phage gpG-like protein